MAENKKNTNSKKSTSSNTKKNSSVKKNTPKEVKKVKEEASKKVKEVKEKKVLEVKEEKKDNFFKKHLSDIIMLGVALVLVVVGIFAFNSKSNKENYLVELSYPQYKEMVDNGESFAFIIESATCVHCQNFMPVVKKFVNDKKVYVYYIDLDKVSQDEYEEFLTSNSYLVENEDWGTPTTLALKGKEAVDSLVGETTEDVFEEFLVKNGIMG